MGNKKGRLIVILISILFLIMGMVAIDKLLNKSSKLGADTNSAATVTYKDWSELSSIDSGYSYSTLFYTKDTNFYVNTNQEEGVQLTKGYTIDDKPVPYIQLGANGIAQVIITNCGIDKYGNMLDVLQEQKAYFPNYIQILY